MISSLSPRVHMLSGHRYYSSVTSLRDFPGKPDKPIEPAGKRSAISIYDIGPLAYQTLVAVNLLEHEILKIRFQRFIEN